MMLWMSFPVLIILAIQEQGALAMEKKESIEELLPFFVAVSINDDFYQENIKAMAVIWRSNLTFLLDGKENSILEIKESYRGLERERYITEKTLYEKAYEACQETKGELLTYQGKVSYCPFFDFGSGKTRDAFEVFEGNLYPYLISVPSYKDETIEKNLFYYYFRTDMLEKIEWEEGDTVISAKGTADLFRVEDSQQVESDDSYLQILERDSSDYVTWIKVKDRIVGGELFRKRLGLSSSCFSIEQQEDQIRISCKGSGHGFGYSQYGGNAMAKDGKDYESLLKHYFPELCIEKDV